MSQTLATTNQVLTLMTQHLPLELILKILQSVEFQIVIPGVAMLNSRGSDRNNDYTYTLRLGIDCWEDITIGMKWSLPCETKSDILVLQTYEVMTISKTSMKLKETQVPIASAKGRTWNNAYYTPLDYTPVPTISHKTIKYAKEGRRNDWTGLGTSRHHFDYEPTKTLSGYTAKVLQTVWNRHLFESGDIAFGGYKHPKNSFADLFHNDEHRPADHGYMTGDFGAWTGRADRMPDRLAIKTVPLVNPF